MDGWKREYCSCIVPMVTSKQLLPAQTAECMHSRGVTMVLIEELIKEQSISYIVKCIWIIRRYVKEGHK